MRVLVVENKMTSRREELKRRVQEANKNPWIARRYNAELKRAAVEYGLKRREEGAKVAEIAEELGLMARTFERWLRRARLQIDAGKIPFELDWRRRRTGPPTVRQAADGKPEKYLGTTADHKLEVQPELRAEKALVFIVRMSDIKLEPAETERLCEWLRVGSAKDSRKD